MAKRELISSYDQPIILGLTPYTATRISVAANLPDWPPFLEADRLARYDDFSALIENRHQDVFSALQVAADQENRIAIAVALPELLCDVWADAVWSDPPVIELGTQALADRWTEIDRANDFSEALGWESIFGLAGWGTSVLYLRRDETRREEFDTDVVIEEIDPGIYFPILKPGSSRIVEAVTLAWQENRGPEDKPETWQVAELHFVDDGQYTVVTKERRAREALTTQEWRLARPIEQPEGVDFLPFIDTHAKRWRGRYWGVSELSRAMGLFDELDNTLSNIAEILEYHGKPMLQVPKTAIFGGVLEKGANRTLGVTADQKDIARYITYDGQITAALAELDKVLELIFLTAQVPRTYFGLGTESTPASGVSLKLQLQNYLKKAGRYQGKETMRLNTLVPMALRLDGQTGDARALRPEISHGSPLPADEEQEVRIITAANTAGLLSKKAAIRRMKRLGYVDDIDDELSEIDAEREASISALPAPLQRNIGGNSATDPNAGDEPPA